MRPGILDAGYRCRPLTDAHRAKLSAMHRTRLGIPDGYCRIYGVHVPLSRAEPLRTYACETARLRGYDAAREFVLNVERSNCPIENPFPPRLKALGPYLPPREYVRLKALRRFARGFHILVKRLSGTYRVYKTGDGTRTRTKIDWSLVEALLADGATEPEIVQLLGANAEGFSHQLLKRGLRHPKRRYVR